MRIAIVVAAISLYLIFCVQFTSADDASKKLEGALVSNVAIYMATTFAAANEYNASYITTRGALIATWSKQVKHFTLVADSDISASALEKFQASHLCRSLGLAHGPSSRPYESGEGARIGGNGEQNFGGPVPTALHCSAWGIESRVLLTGCAPVWFGVTGPCCKADQAFRDFFARDLLSLGVDWLLYSDDDLLVRPLVLQRFLASFDPSLPFVLGADKASAKFRGTPNPKANRAVLRACWRELPQCASALEQGQHYNVRAGVPFEACTEPPPLRKARYRRRRGQDVTSSTSMVSPIQSVDSMKSLFSNIDSNARALGMELKPPTRADIVAAEAHAAWKPCRSPVDTQACVECLNTTLNAVETCMGPHQAYFPGNLQPLIASRASLQRLKPALSSGVAVRRTCDEWGVTHDGAMVMLAWMHRLPYASTLADCEVYSFAKRLAGNCLPSTVALIDRVKSSADADFNECPAEEQRIKSGMISSISKLPNETMNGKQDHMRINNLWGQCLAAKDFLAARPVLMDTSTRTTWYTRTRGQLVRQVQSSGDANAGIFGRNPANAEELLVTAETSREMLANSGSVAEGAIYGVADAQRQRQRSRNLMAKGFGFGAGPLELTSVDGSIANGVAAGEESSGSSPISSSLSNNGGTVLLLPGWKSAVDVFSMDDCRAHVPFVPAAPTPQPPVSAVEPMPLNNQPRNTSMGIVGKRRKNVEAPLGPVLLLSEVQRELRDLWPEVEETR